MKILSASLALGVVCAAALAAATPATARQQASAQLQQIDDAFPGDLINDPLDIGWEGWGEGIRKKTIETKDVPGQYATQISIKKPLPHIFDAGVNVPVTGDIKKGDKIMVALWARSVSTDAADDKGSVHVRVQEKTQPYAGFGDTDLSFGNEWKLYNFTATADRDLKAGSGVVTIQFGVPRQVLELSSVYVVNNGA